MTSAAGGSDQHRWPAPTVTTVNSDLPDLPSARLNSATKFCNAEAIEIAGWRWSFQNRPILQPAVAERDENVQRQPWAPSEAVEIAEAIEEVERQHTRRGRPSKEEKFSSLSSDSEGRKVAAKVAKSVGMSRPTLAKAKEVAKAADENPVAFADLKERMDKSGKVE